MSQVIPNTGSAAVALVAAALNLAQSTKVMDDNLEKKLTRFVTAYDVIKTTMEKSSEAAMKKLETN